MATEQTEQHVPPMTPAFPSPTEPPAPPPPPEPPPESRDDDDDARFDELPEETAKRLLTGNVRRTNDETRKLRARAKLHVRHLSPFARTLLIDWLRADFEKTLGVFDDIADEPPEFSFPGDDPY